MQVQRGEVFFACLDPVFGRELGGFKARPVLVVSINAIASTRLVVVVPGTSKALGKFPNIVAVQPSPTNGLTGITYFQCHQIRAIEQARLMTSRSIGKLSPEDLARIEEAMAYCLGLTLPE
jgi:mRNA-degrading endonuclease toxin of MazEF toxin-antitoxin module